MRQSIAGADLRQVVQGLLEQAGQDEANAPLWMNLATAFFAIGLRDMGLSIQAEALRMQRSYALPAEQQPAKFRLLMIMAPGDIAENTPLDCMLEGSDIDLLYYYATSDAPLPASLPPHDALFVAMADAQVNRPILAALEIALRGYGKPVINAPRHIPNTERSTASQLLQGVPGLLMPPTCEVSRTSLAAIASGACPLDSVLAGGQFPIILRPVGSQAGRDLARIEDSQGISAYLANVPATAFYMSRFIDYSGDDGVFRKYRIALIAGQPFACHMGVSTHWMIHYINAGMYEDAAKRAEEARFMADFADFARRHAGALQAIAARTQLDYVSIDCAETRAGELLIFEVDHVMVVHAMDSEALFPYKQVHMRKVRQAMESFLLQLKAPQ